MANTKKLQRAAIRFRRTEPELYHNVVIGLYSISSFIKKTGSIEVIYKNNECHDANRT